MLRGEQRSLLLDWLIWLAEGREAKTSRNHDLVSLFAEKLVRNFVHFRKQTTRDLPLFIESKGVDHKQSFRLSQGSAFFLTYQPGQIHSFL